MASLLLLNHPPVLIGSGCDGPVPMTPATRASLGWVQGPLAAQGLWVPITGLHMPRRVLPWSERSSSQAVPEEAPAVAWPKIWPWSPRSREGELWHQADEGTG